MFSSATVLGNTAARRILRSEDDQPVARSLARQSFMVAAACLVTDVVSFATRGPDLSAVNLVFLAGIVVADAALATAPRLSGWVALVHAILLPVLAVVLPGRSASTAGQLVAAYRAGAWLRGCPAAGSLIVLAIGVLSSLLVSGLTEPVNVLSLVIANALLPWLVGRYTTGRKAYVDELRHQREAAVRDAEAELNQALTREREAIAIDLHDVIAHHVSAIGVHATAARLNLADNDRASTGRVQTSLAAVEGSSRAAMTDLQRLLSLLHEGEESADQPGLAKLPDLFDGVRASGLQVSFVVYDDPRPIPRGIDTMLYRVVQEMMTNALRHGDGGVARVELEYSGDHVSVTTRNRIRSSDRHDVPAGHRGLGVGLDGMRKRAEVLGGSMSAGPVGDGQYWESTVTMPAGSES